MTEHIVVTNGVHHVGLTVVNLVPVQQFFVNVLGFKVLGERPEYPAVFLSDDITMITLWQVRDPLIATPFDRKNVVGLHHLAFTINDDAELDNLHRRLDGLDSVTVEFAPENLGNGPARHFIALIPSGIRVEFIAPNK